MDAQVEPAPTKPLTHRESRLIVWSVLLPLFLGSLDNTILASALPTIGRDFGDVHSLPWLITIYLLAATAVMPLYGKIADIRGRLYAMRIALAFYLGGSLIAALAPSMGALIAARALQGLGGAGLSGIAIIVLGDVAAPADRGRYYAYFSITYTTAGAVGPALGGFIADHLHWSAIFWINIPLGLLAAAVTNTLLKRLPRYERPHRLDVIGALLIVIASVSFMLALNIGGKFYPWLSLPVELLLVIALAVGGAFIWRLLTAPEPLIPIAILREPIVRWAALANSLGWAGIVGLNIFLPMYLQSVYGLSPTTAGLSLMILMVTLNTNAGLCGQLLGRVKHYKILPVCLFTVALGSVILLAMWADRMTGLTLQVLLFLLGAGFGPMPGFATVSMQNVVERHQLGIALGTMSFMRALFTTIMVALLGAIVLTVATSLTPGGDGGFDAPLGPEAQEAALAFRAVFLTIAGCLTLSFISMVLIEQRPLRSDVQTSSK
jgi:MFS family permease